MQSKVALLFSPGKTAGTSGAGEGPSLGLIWSLTSYIRGKALLDDIQGFYFLGEEGGRKRRGKRVVSGGPRRAQLDEVM